MTALRWPLSTKKKMDLMSDNVYYLQDAFKPKASESDSQLSQFETDVYRILAQNNELKTARDLDRETISQLQQLVQECQSELEILSNVERALAQKKSEVAILRFVARNKRSLKN